MPPPEDRFDSIIRELRHSGHKIPPQPMAIVKIPAASEGHPSAEDIHQQLDGEFPTMSLATVYRNILLLQSLGEVLELGFPDISYRHDDRRPFSHPHLISIECKKILDPGLGRLDGMKKEVASETNFMIPNHRLDFFGVCGDCGARKA